MIRLWSTPVRLPLLGSFERPSPQGSEGVFSAPFAGRLGSSGERQAISSPLAAAKRAFPAPIADILEPLGELTGNSPIP